MTSYDLSMFDTPRQPKAPEAKYDLSMLDQGQPKTIWQPLQPEQVQAATTIASFGDATKSASMDKLQSELRQYLGDSAPMVSHLNLDDAKRQLQRAQMDHVLRDSPHTARWFTEQVQQGKTPYDVGTLANIERVTRVAPLLPYAAARGAYNTLGGLTAAPGGFADVVGQTLEPVFGKLPKSELTSIGNFITEYGRKATGSVPDNLTIGEKGLVAGVESLGANLTTFGMAPFGLQATLATMATSVGGSTYLENLKATGNSAAALLHGILDAGYEYIFEKMGGTGVLFDKAAWAKTFLGGVAKFAAREIPTELATTVAQKADQYILQNPERTFEQFMAEMPEDLVLTAIATLVGGGGQVAIFKGVEALANMGNTTAKAQTAHDNLTALLDNVAKAELYLNDPDTFAQFFQGVAGDATVTVDPVKLVEAMTAANVTEEALPSLKDQLNAPGEIELTVQELATAFAGTGAETTLLQHVRPEPDLPTLAESKEQTKTAFEAFQEAGEKALARFQADEVFNENLKAVKEEIVADILHTGRAGKHYAEGYGTLMAHFYATMAKAHGVTPLQIRDGWTDANGVEHRGYNPRVVGPTGQVRGRTPATTVDFKRGRVANLMNRDNWAVLEAGNPNGTEATPEENAASMAKLKAYLDKEGIEYHDAKGSYFGTKADSLMLLGVTAERASEIGNMFGQESITTRHGLVFGDGTVAQATGIKEVKDTEAEDHTFLPAFGSAFRLEIPESAFENRVKLNEVLNQSVSTRTPTQKAGRPDPHLTTGLDVDYAVVEGDEDLVGRMAAVVKTYPGVKKGLRNPNKIVEAFIKHVEGNLSWLYDNVPPEIRERSKLWYDGGRRIIERWVDKYGFTDAQIAGVIAVLSPQTEWDMNVTRAERILDIWTQRQDFALSDEMNAEADAIDSIKPVLREAIRGKKLSELDSDLLRGVWIRVYDQAHNPRVVRGITPEGGFAEFKKTKGGKEKTSTWGSFAEIGKAVRILRDGSIPNISRSLGSEHKVRNFYNNLFDPSDSRSVTIDTHAVAAGLLRPLAGGSIEVGDNLGARPRHDQTGTNGTYVLYAEAYRRVAMAKGVLPRELQSITWEAVRRLFPDSYKSDATRAEIDALWKPNETGKESADEIRSKILDNRGGRIPNPAWERSGTGLDVGQPSSTYQSGILERSWADGTPGTRAGGYFAQTVPATGKPAGLTITGVHFSPAELTALLPSKYGKGLEGAERARVMASKDARITRRTHFYVNTGQGVFPEYGVGGKAHVSELANLYDADVDALGLFKGKTDEQLNAAESAVLDAGYSGYVMRGFGNQGAAVVFGARVGDTIPTKFVGGKTEANVPVAPAAQYSETQRLRQALTTSKDLPHGAMTAAKWREHIGRVLPDLLPKIEASGAFERVQGMVYRDELARAIEPPEGQFYQSGWYSPLTRAFQNAKQAAMPGSQWASWLAGNKAKLGLKDDEIQWSGLNEYLELRGKDKVTREEIVDYLNGNGVKVEETVLGGAQGVTEKDLDNAEVEARRTGDWAAYEDLARRYEDEQLGNDANNSGNKTLYASYVPPGGIPGTYVEILETLPSDTPTHEEVLAIEAKMRQAREERNYAEIERLTKERVGMAKSMREKPTFRSFHWSEPNVLVHIRLDEVTGADGKRYVRVGEVQSDWGQEGKKKGFGGLIVEKAGEWWNIKTQAGEIVDQQTTEARAQAVAAQTRATPSGPFVTDTKAWVALGIKRAIMHAVDVGADGVVFSTGEQNAALYSLEKRVDAISYAKTSDGKYVVSALKDGHSVLDRTGTPEELENVVGKEIVKKMLAGVGREVGAPEGSGELSGLDLKIGGEGMKAFYDKIVPQVANDVLKKLGAGVKVEKFIVPTPVDEATTDRALVMDEDVEHFGFSITPEFRAKIMEGVPLFQVKPAYAVRSPDGKYQGIRELTDAEARELIDLGYQINRVAPGYGQKQNAIGGFNPTTMEITLLAQSDQSTFLHETGHFFLTVYADMAAQEGAPKQIVDDMNAILKWFGIAPGFVSNSGRAVPGMTALEVWNNMSTDEQRPYHEQFAESSEQYLFSGKAPTRELQTLFQRFAKWLTKVYGSIQEFVQTHPGAKLNPELEAIMGRMLATEEEIKQAEDNRNYEALFRTAAEAGMTPAQFAAYLDLPEEARAVAEEQLRTRSLRDMKWLQNRKNKTVAALQKEAAAVRAEVRKEVAETVAQEPIFRALRWLKRGELTNPDTGEEVKVTAGNKLSIPALEEMYPEGALGDKPDWRSLGYGQYGMLANKGLHPDVVADMFGFDSGAALVDALVNAPKFKDEVEGRTDQIMLERHGDLSSPDKIAQAADEAIHNEVRTKIVATELSFLDKLTGSPSFLIKAAKEYARQLVANRTSKTLKAWVFAADEVRASKAAAAALKKGDTKAAANHKRVELLNHAAVREAHAAEKELKKIVDRLRKIASYKDDDSSAKARDMDMVNAVRVVLYRFGLGTERKGKAATEYLSLVETNDPAMGAALRDLVDSTTDNAKDWRDLKLSELRDLHAAVEAVWTLAKRSRQMEVDGKLVPRRQIEQELYDRLDEIGIPDTVPGETSAVTESERNWMKFSTFVAALRRVESWVEAKDGKAMGPFRKYIWSQIKDAADTYRVKKAEYLKAYRELLDTIAPTLKRELIDAREIGYTFGKGEGGMGMVELLHAILHTGNASNKRKLLLGRGWATDNGDGTLDTSKWDAFIARMIQEGKLTKAHYDFAQGVWDLLDNMKPAAQKAHRSVFGRYFAEVTADAFTTPFGDYRGGYVPAQADPEIVQDAQLKELANQENENMVYAFPSTPRGFTKSRVEYNRPLRLDLRSLAGHIDKVLLFSYLTEPVSDVRRVLMSKTVSQALGRVDPKAIGVMLTPWLNRVAKQIVEDRVPGREPLARFWSAARARAGMSAMFANLANSAQQVTGVALAAVKVRPKYLLESLAHNVMSPRKLAAQVAEMSPYMRDRMHNDVVLMGEAIDEILLNPTLLQSTKAWSAKHAYFMQRAVDNYLSPMVWMGAFNQAKENGSDDLEARRLADSAVRETQGSQAPEDIAAFEQGTAFYRMFVQFAGYFNMNANLLGTEFVKLSQDMGLKKGAGRGLYVLALGFYVPAVLGELIIQAFRGGPDDDDKDGEYLDDWLAAVFGYGPARYLTAMAPVAGQAANALVNTLNHKPYDDRISTAPAISMIESAVKAPVSVYKAITDEGKSTKAINDTATLISMTVGVPARAVAKPISYLTGVANEEIAPEDTYDAIRGTITGTASPGSKQ